MSPSAALALFSHLSLATGLTLARVRLQVYRTDQGVLTRQKSSCTFSLALTVSPGPLRPPVRRLQSLRGAFLSPRYPHPRIPTPRFSSQRKRLVRPPHCACLRDRHVKRFIGCRRLAPLLRLPVLFHQAFPLPTLFELSRTCRPRDRFNRRPAGKAEGKRVTHTATSASTFPSLLHSGVRCSTASRAVCSPCLWRPLRAASERPAVSGSVVEEETAKDAQQLLGDGLQPNEPLPPVPVVDREAHVAAQAARLVFLLFRHRGRLRAALAAVQRKSALRRRRDEDLGEGRRVELVVRRGREACERDGMVSLGRPPIEGQTEVRAPQCSTSSGVV